VKGEKFVVVSSDASVLGTLRNYAPIGGYSIVFASNGLEGHRAVRREFPDAVLIDSRLPDVDGFDLCRHLKSDVDTQNVPIVIFSESRDQSDVMLALGVGAEDFLTKPLRPRELVARIEAILRRYRPGSPRTSNEERVVWGDIVIDVGRHEVFVGGRKVEFTLTEFRLLQYFAARSGRVLSRETLVQQVLGKDAGTRTIDVHVQSIRKKLGRYGGWIDTVRGVGYRPKVP
jgi:DNA-binding response OmpR family regulator